MHEPVFAIGTGRCGTQFLHKVLANEKKVASSHERHPLNDTFHRYCKWYNLPVDHAGFLRTKKLAIENDLNTSEVSFESSAFLSFSVHELYQAFNSRFILLVRSPERVINSYIRKGWYERPVVIDDPHKIPSFQETKQFHHFLGRTLPKGDELVRWNALSQVGKLAWFWNTLNRDVLRQFAELPPSQTKIVRLEDLDYEKYSGTIAPFIGFKATVSSNKFESLTKEKPNSFDRVQSVVSWSEREKQEFISEVSEMAAVFGYNPVQILNAPPVEHASPRHRHKTKKSKRNFIKRLINKLKS